MKDNELLLFHLYADDTVRTPLEEHLVEGALYAQDENKNVHVHFTVSPEHRELFAARVEATKARYEEEFGVKYDITFHVICRSYTIFSSIFLFFLPLPRWYF